MHSSVGMEVCARVPLGGCEQEGVWCLWEAGVDGLVAAASLRALAPAMGGVLGPPADCDIPFLSQLLYTLTFWLLLRQFVKEKLLKRAEAPAALMEVTVADTGEWQARGGGCPPARPLRCHRLPPGLAHRAHTDADAAAEPGGAGEGHLCQVLDLCVCRHVHRGQLRRPPRGLQDCLHVPLPALPHPLPGGWRAGVGAGAWTLPAALTAPLVRQVYYSLWRKLLKAFWWLVVAYTMLVLIAVYTFQFQDFPAYWRNLTGFTDEQ